jgi:hypothetical protein
MVSNCFGVNYVEDYSLEWSGGLESIEVFWRILLISFHVLVMLFFFWLNIAEIFLWCSNNYGESILIHWSTVITRSLGLYKLHVHEPCYSSYLVHVYISKDKKQRKKKTFDPKLSFLYPSCWIESALLIRVRLYLTYLCLFEYDRLLRYCLYNICFHLMEFNRPVVIHGLTILLTILLFYKVVVFICQINHLQNLYNIPQHFQTAVLNSSLE